MIVPRWEWRTFGESFGDAEARLRAIAPERVQETDELYLLSARSDASVKVRDGVLDVKRLEDVNADGLERWRPVTKAGEPVAAADAASALTDLGVEAPPLARSEYTFAELVDELVAPTDALLAVRVHKRREHFRFCDCSAELSEVRTDRGSTRTIAVESEDAARVAAAVGELGLGSRRNVCVARGLKALVGFGARRYAVIDVGTNSVKFHLGERAADGAWTTVDDRAEITRLGEGLDRSGELGEEPIERTVEAIAGFVDEARARGAVEIAAVGTAGLRLAVNADRFLDAARERTGVEVEVISGDEEARLAYLAVKQGIRLGAGSLVVFDTGGGSSQFTFGRGDHVDESFSVNVGAARFTERFGLDGTVERETVASALAAIGADLAPLDGRPTPDTLVGMGGAVTNLAAVRLGLATYDHDAVRGAVLDDAEVDRQIELYRARTADERRRIVGLQPKRAEVILAGACIVRTVLAKLGRDSLTVSDAGLRHGLIVERFGQ